MKFLHLIRNRQLAYELLREYEYNRDRELVDLTAWTRALVESGHYAERIDTRSAQRWREAIERAMGTFPDAPPA